MSRQLDVYVDWNGPVHAGRLWIHRQKGRESASFEYTREWLETGFAFEPALPLVAGSFHTEPSLSLFRSFADSAPDRWGRVLLKRQEAFFSRRDARPPKTLLESDFLLGVNDVTRQGAFRFTEAGRSVFLTQPEAGYSVPPLVRLRAVLNASVRVAAHSETEQDLRLLLAPGSSLGGARPKASVTDEKGRLMIAKFPHPHDEWDVPLWEYVAFCLAREAGLDVPDFRLETVGDLHVLLVGRFDRTRKSRVPFASAMTLLEAQDGENRSYLELAEVVQQDGARPAADLRELWKRMVFNVLIANVDDHLRNHGFLREAEGWVLSPVYDLEATPATHKARILHTFITDSDGTAEPELALSVAKYFGLSPKEAVETVAAMQKVVSRWEMLARQTGAKAHEIELMRSAFTLPD